jgi:N-acetylglucosaminyldiphosphoundecaprenol N-acetyl-beta-D-mannosaminyltransferase
MSLGKPFHSMDLLGVRVDRIHLTELLGFLRDAGNSDRPVSVLYLNPHVWNLARNDSDLLAALDGADVVWCDGVGILLAARVLGSRLPERMTVPDFIDDVCHQCVVDSRSLYFLGGEEGVARRTAEILRRRHPGLKVVGSHHGYLGKPEVEAKVLGEIRRLAPDLLLVGMGSPRQEMWIARHLQGLNVKVGWAVGALFDHLTGKVPRAPHWASTHGLEWLHRLMVEPRRLWRRYLLGNARFLAAVIAARMSGVRARTSGGWSH